MVVVIKKASNEEESNYDTGAFEGGIIQAFDINRSRILSLRKRMLIK